MKVSDLKLFIKVVELGSFTAAANALDLPRANVSRRINDLESTLRTPLFHRTTRSLSLTNQGESYYLDLLKAVEMIDSANQALIHNADTIKGKVKLGLVSETHDILQPILFSFLDRYPDVELDVRVISNGFIDMHNQGLDISFHGGELIDSDLVARKLIQLDRCLVTSQSYIDKFGQPSCVEELTNHHAICLRWPTGEVDKRWHFEHTSITVNSKLVSNSVAFLKSATISGRGIAFLPKILVADEIADGRLVQILSQSSVIEEHGYILYNQPKTLNLATKTLIDYLLEEVPKNY
ncbi:LysR family transcriptional regulator [Vibrio algarum]|uniref:LysR family transcriptional regulator n=1 Tax=Vibrio algarum TaxID=3020714 RepID=A0ABT4YU92_9VIBR|nr:LysR family transcriptional regulator [Vibrio sp. KJ40-1]MDB1125149.1 LysR family transcriptional regulator [Vibrio sp. KJ40-1]